MITLRKAKERGHFNYGWLNTYHTFSFARYYNPKYLGYSDLLVINEDRVKPGQGFPTHPHKDMEIISYVLEGALEHKDSLGNGSVIVPGEVQRMSAGRGVTHSEYNHSKTELVHFLQIWLVPNVEGIEPGYEQKTYSDAEKLGRLRLVASPDGSQGSVTIYQDARLFATLLETGQAVTYQLAVGRHAWVHVARGSIILNGQPLEESDGAAIEDETTVQIVGNSPVGGRADVLLFDLV